MNDEANDTILSVPKPQSDGADQPSLLQPTSAEPSSVTATQPAGTTVTIHLAPEHAEAAHQALAVAGDTIGPMIGKLLGLDAPAAPAAPKPNRTRQRKRWWLASCRGWARSTATTACWRRASEARLTGLAPAAAAKPTPFKGNARSKSKSRNKGKRRGR